MNQESPTEGLFHWLEARWKIALSSVALMACTAVWGYFWGLPLVASHLAREITPKTEKALGVSLLNTLDQRILKPSELDAKQKNEIVKGFQRLTAGLSDQALLSARIS